MNIEQPNKITDLVAVALKYREEKAKLPKIVAQGKGDIAKEIIKIAQQENIHIEKNEELAAVLSLLQVDDLIPIETFVSVAEIISFIYKKDK